jgi:hypothetical protein
MASKLVMDAVEARLATAWTHTVIVTPNTNAGAPPDGGAFLSVQYPVASEEQMSIGAPGANVFREEGVARFIIHVPTGEGRTGWDEKVDALRAAFRGKVLDDDGHIRTYEASPPIANDENDEGNYYAMSFGVRYTADIHG